MIDAAAGSADWTRAAVRWVFLVHRYLGIGVSVLMVSWCLSGMVMMYVSFPSLAQSERVAALAPLQLKQCCQESTAAGAIEVDSAVQEVRVEMLAGRAVADITAADGRRLLTDLISGQPIRSVSQQQAASVATLYAQRRGLPSAFSSVARLGNDQWTTAENFDAERPLYKFTWPDAHASELYVSAVSGMAMQFTTTPVRFWNWLGAIPHWVYFTALREHALLWTQFIIYTSIAGCFLTLTGLYIGVRQYLRRPLDRLSPYRGYLWWHHVPGLIFGGFALSWVLSGLLSMTPWGLLDGGRARAERQQLQGSLPHWGDVRSALGMISTHPEEGDLVSLRSASLDGRLYFIGTNGAGQRIRLDARGRAAELSPPELWRAAQRLGGAGQPPPQWLGQPDRFYFSHHSTPAVLPVYRVVLNDAQHTRYYLDPVSGEILKKVDLNARGYRWLHEGLHRLDFAAPMRARPTWDIVMLALLLGTSLICGTGLYSAVLRLIRRPQRSRMA